MKMKNDKALARLKTVEGHIRGIEKMVENGEYCIDIIRQIQAVQSALSKIGTIVLDGHLNTCLVTAIRGEDVSERERVLKEIADIYDTATKV
jgi:DNA-binding FrmR family transcriptional regulator